MVTAFGSEHFNLIIRTESCIGKLFPTKTLDEHTRKALSDSVHLSEHILLYRDTQRYLFGAYSHFPACMYNADMRTLNLRP